MTAAPSGTFLLTLSAFGRVGLAELAGPLLLLMAVPTAAAVLAAPTTPLRYAIVVGLSATAAYSAVWMVHSHDAQAGLGMLLVGELAIPCAVVMLAVRGVRRLVRSWRHHSAQRS